MGESRVLDDKPSLFLLSAREAECRNGVFVGVGDRLVARETAQH